MITRVLQSSETDRILSSVLQPALKALVGVYVGLCTNNSAIICAYTRDIMIPSPLYYTLSRSCLSPLISFPLFSSFSSSLLCIDALYSISRLT